MKTALLICILASILMVMPTVGNAASTTLLAAAPDALRPAGPELIETSATDAFWRLQDIVQTAPGGSHTCALTSTGEVLCWGYNGSGQLGDGTNTNRLTPVGVKGLGSPVQAITAGDDFTCALTAAGSMLCWGSNSYGQLGYGTGPRRNTPVQVSGLESGVKAIEAGANHACALKTTGALLCWGDNSYGQLGDGTQTWRSTPTPVSGLATGVKAVAGSYYHTCALTTAGAVSCWGDNYAGQLGDGTEEDHLTPAPVSGLASGVQAITAGFHHTCALTDAGGVLCWGARYIGDGTLTNDLTPVPVSGLAAGVRAIAGGSGFTCALTAAGGVVCWGDNFWGQMGDGTITDRPTPVLASGLDSGVQAIATQRSHSCAVTATGNVKCWGENRDGQLGDGTTTVLVTPVTVTGLTNALRSITPGWLHTCAINSAGGLLCWGYNAHGQLGDGTTTVRPTPVPVSGLAAGVAAVEPGNEHTCALTAAGAVLCWGWNTDGQLGNGSHMILEQKTPGPVSGLGSGVQALGTGWEHTCAVTSGGGAVCWGDNSRGQLGDGSDESRNAPVPVTGLSSGVKAVAAGWEHTCALTAAGGVLCWGGNDSGQLGDGTTTERPAPVAVSGLGSGVQAITAGTSHTCALTSAGAVLCWGGGGRVGDGTFEKRLTPTPVTGLSGGAQAISGRRNHTCAVTAAGGVLCWGRNSLGQLGDGTTLDRNVPVAVVGLGSGVQAIGTGELHSCAVTSAGAALCWGANDDGQLGDGTRRFTPAGVQVACYGLTLSHTGEGSDPTPASAKSAGCPAPLYLARERLTLTASPATEWRVAGWSGTENNASTATTNALVMPAGEASVSVRYEPDTVLPTRFVFLPLLSR